MASGTRRQTRQSNQPLYYTSDPERILRQSQATMAESRFSSISASDPGYDPDDVDVTGAQAGGSIDPTAARRSTTSPIVSERTQSVPSTVVAHGSCHSTTPTYTHYSNPMMTPILRSEVEAMHSRSPTTPLGSDSHESSHRSASVASSRHSQVSRASTHSLRTGRPPSTALSRSTNPFRPSRSGSGAGPPPPLPPSPPSWVTYYSSSHSAPSGTGSLYSFPSGPPSTPPSGSSGGWQPPTTPSSSSHSSALSSAPPSGSSHASTRAAPPSGNGGGNGGSPGGSGSTESSSSDTESTFTSELERDRQRIEYLDRHARDPPGPPGPPGPGGPGGPGVGYPIIIQQNDKLDVAKPDKFSGEKRHMLEVFLNQCVANFIAKRELYRTDRNRIIFAGSYFTGRANTWFGGYLPDLDNDVPEHTFLRTWAAFREELIIHFGVMDPRANALVQINLIKHSENQRVTDYKLEFDELAKHLHWNDEALADKFFLGLHKRIKDIFGQRSARRPTGLSELAALAIRIDENYWLYNRTTNKSDNKPGGSDSADKSKSNRSGSGQSSHTTGSTNARSSNTSGSRKSKSNKSSSNKSSKPDLSDKLTSGGRLTAEERERRVKENLCMYCGGRGHQAKECKKAAHNHQDQKDTKARASKSDGSEAKSDNKDAAKKSEN